MCDLYQDFKKYRNTFIWLLTNVKEANTSESIMFYSYNDVFFIILIFLVSNSSGKDNLEDLVENDKIYAHLVER